MADLSAQSLEDEPIEVPAEASTKAEKPRMIARPSRLALGIGCGSCILVVGIICIVLGAMGFFTFKEPCVGVHSFTIGDLELDFDGESSSNTALMGILDGLTGGSISALIPKKATMTIEIVMEVNNTNPYDLDYEQGEEGTIAIPAAVMEEGSDEIPEEHPDDLILGTWEIPPSTLKKKARNEIPISVTTTIDLLDSSTFNLASVFMGGGSFMFRLKGGIEGSSWVPGLEGQTEFLCLAKMDDIKNYGEDALVRCRHSTKIGDLMNREGELEFQGSEGFFEGEDDVDPACLV